MWGLSRLMWNVGSDEGAFKECNTTHAHLPKGTANTASQAVKANGQRKGRNVVATHRNKDKPTDDTTSGG